MSDAVKPREEPEVPRRAAAEKTGPSLGAFELYKPGQGVYVRWGSAGGAGVILLGLANYLYEQLAGFSLEVRTLVPVLVLAAAGYAIFRLVGQTRGIVDFMIATEGEMKKVNWSSRREIIGATKVVIVVVLLLAFILFTVDVAFMFLFESIGVLRIGFLDQLFRSAPGS